MAQEFQYFALIVAVLFVPKVLLRFRIPSGLTAIAIGIATTYFLGWFSDSQTVSVLGALGITSLFLFAGFEVDMDDLKRDGSVLLKHIAQSTVIIIVCSWALSEILDLSTRASVVLALGLTTPSTGFILSSLNGFNFTDRQKYWIRSKAIATEILALGILFFALQSESVEKLSVSLMVILGLIFSLPVIFKFFLKKIAPFAPDSEVKFMILLAFVCGVITQKLGTYYLIGAFIVGVVAAQFNHFIKTDNAEKMFYAIRFFSALFIPFYFFQSGLTIDITAIDTKDVTYGLIFFMIFVPFRLLNVFASVHFFLRECWNSRYKISFSLMPTLIFGLVIASILRTKFAVPTEIVNGLILYTILSSITPSIFLKNAPPEEYDSSVLNPKG